MKIEVLPHRQLGVERERLRHVADPIARTHIAGARGSPNSSASPSLGGRRPVSIFMVVVLPQPFEPRKPKISPRSMVKLTWSTAVKSPNRRVRSRATMTGAPVEDAARRYSQPPMAAALLLGKQRDKRLFKRRRAGARLEFGRRPARQHFARAHRRQPVEPLRLFHVGGGDHHAHAGTARAHAVDQLPELPARQRIDAGRRLVEDQKIRIVNEAAAKAELLPHAAG